MEDSFNNQSHRVVFIVGSTASGKSEWAMQMAQRWGGVIVNCDSVQCYQGLKIGSALPSEMDMASVPHYLYAYVPEGNVSTAGQYTRDFFSLLEQFEAPNLFWVVGGTGFYFQALEKGMYPVQEISPAIKIAVANEMQAPGGQDALYAELLRRDPEAACKISSHDAYRIGRAIELMRNEGMSLTAIQKKFSQTSKAFPYPLLKVGIRRKREELESRISERTEKMLALGLVEEVQILLNKGLLKWPPLASVGYRETIQYLLGESDRVQGLVELKREIIRSTLRLTKKQRTWFQRDKSIWWIEPGALLTGSDQSESLGHDLLESFLKGNDWKTKVKNDFKS